MLYNSFQNLSLSALGFGTMRLPTLPDGEIDQEQLDKMVDLAMAAGVNYFDTAYPYHNGKSELAVGRSLARYPRESWYLADKFPGHQNVAGVRQMQPEDIFEQQLVKCGVDYFDFYLLHNVNENSMCYYGKSENRYMEYFLEQKARGRIRHLGFSTHGAPDCIERFLERWGEHLEFCQIQLNYVDWTLQDAERKCEILKKAGIPVWVMEPVRGGKLARFDAAIEEKLRAARPDESIPAWAFRWLRTVPKPTMILSGMSNLAQMEDNLNTFREDRPLSEAELALLDEARASLATMIPCTSCRYCCEGCPMGLDIPSMLAMANDMAVSASFTTVARYTALGDGKRASDCIGCGQCAQACPQKIDVPAELQKLAALMAGQKTWEEICKEREKAADALKNKG